MNKMSQVVKRGADLVLVGLFSPLIVVVTVVTAVLVLVFTGRPVFFCQERAGLGMKPFRLYKFRTMRTDCDPFGPSPKEGVDPRITWLGRWVRALSLDEVPQFYNVLRGEMSLVGPRPLYMEQAREWNERQRRRLEVKPGLTGLAQIRGRGSLTIEEKLEWDVRYAEGQSLWLDVKILFLTVGLLVRPKGIYEERYSMERETRDSAE